MNERDYKISVIIIVRVELFFFSLLSITCPCFKSPGRNLPPFSKMGKFLPGRLIPIRYTGDSVKRLHGAAKRICAHCISLVAILKAKTLNF